MGALPDPRGRNRDSWFTKDLPLFARLSEAPEDPSPERPGLGLRITPDDASGVLRFEFMGTLDASTVPIAERGLSRILRTRPAIRFEFDLRAVREIDSAGVGFLLVRTHRRNGEVAIRGVSPEVEAVFRAIGWDPSVGFTSTARAHPSPEETSRLMGSSSGTP